MPTWYSKTQSDVLLAGKATPAQIDSKIATQAASDAATYVTFNGDDLLLAGQPIPISSGSAPPFSPSDLPGLVAWYRATDFATAGALNGSELPTGTNAWLDASGQGNHLSATALDGAPQNTFLADAGGTGQPGVLISGGYFLPADSAHDPLGGLTAATIIALFIPIDANADGGFIFGSQGRMRLYDQNSKFGMCHWSGWYPYESGTHLTAAPHVAAEVYDGAAQTISGRVDGSALINGNITGAIPENSTTSRLTLGVQNDGIAYPFHGIVLQAFVFNRALTIAELAQIGA